MKLSAVCVEGRDTLVKLHKNKFRNGVQCFFSLRRYINWRNSMSSLQIIVLCVRVCVCVGGGGGILRRGDCNQLPTIRRITHARTQQRHIERLFFLLEKTM
jgi:hypothetical protein